MNKNFSQEVLNNIGRVFKTKNGSNIFEITNAFYINEECPIYEIKTDNKEINLTKESFDKMINGDSDFKLKELTIDEHAKWLLES